jgi:glutamyl-tRNA reductase
MGDLHHRSTAPVIEQLRAGWSETGEAELDRLFRRLPGLDDSQRGEIRQAFERYAAKLLHPPLASLRSESRAGPPHGLLDALKRLFDLKD